jgi:acetyl esterase/lipase
MRSPWGSAETLLDDSIQITARAGAADVQVTLEVWPHMIHAWPLFCQQLTDASSSRTDAVRSPQQDHSSEPRQDSHKISKAGKWVRAFRQARSKPRCSSQSVIRRSYSRCSHSAACT